MNHWKRLISSCAALVLFAAPAWAHPSATPHAHGEPLIPLLAAAGLLAFVRLMRRAGSRAR